MLDNSLKLVLYAVSNTEQLWRSFRAITAGKKWVLLTFLTTAWLITRKSRDERNCVGVMVLKVCVIKRL